MDSWEVVRLVVTAVTGGLGGAGLTILWNLYKNRIKVISVRQKVSPILTKGAGSDAPSVLVTISDETGRHELPNLNACELHVTNTSNEDYDSFTFGITTTYDSIVFVQSSGADRHHVVSMSKTPSPSNHLKAVDLTCTPFTRGDRYSFTVYVAPLDSYSRPSDLRIGTPMKGVKLSGDVGDRERYGQPMFLLYASVAAGLSIGAFTVVLAVILIKVLSTIEG